MSENHRMNFLVGLRTVLTTLGAICLLLCASVGAQTSAATTTSQITIEVCCSSQLKVDAPHTVTIVMQNPGGTGTTVVVNVPKGTTSQAAAGLVATAIGQGFGITTPVVKENVAPHFARGTAWSIDLPEGTPPVRTVRVQKWVSGHPQDDDGHMKVWDKKIEKISNPHPPIITGFQTLQFKQVAWMGSSKTMELYLAGHDDNGTPFTYSQSLTYVEGGYQPPNVFAGLARFFAGLGMTVSYPSSTEMLVTVCPSALHIEEAEFTIWDSTSNPGSLPYESEVSWEFSALH
jgi:hypothetical protein